MADMADVPPSAMADIAPSAMADMADIAPSAMDDVADAALLAMADTAPSSESPPFLKCVNSAPMLHLAGRVPAMPVSDGMAYPAWT